MTIFASVPFALIGGLLGFFGKRNLRVAGLLLNFLALIPAVVATIIVVAGIIALKEGTARLHEEARLEEQRPNGTNPLKISNLTTAVVTPLGRTARSRVK